MRGGERAVQGGKRMEETIVKRDSLREVEEKVVISAYCYFKQLIIISHISSFHDLNNQIPSRLYNLNIFSKNVDNNIIIVKHPIFFVMIRL